MGTNDPVIPTLTAEHSKMISECRADGMRKRFETVLSGMMNGRMPKDVDTYFARFVSESQSITVARDVFNYWQGRFGNNIRFRRAFGIVMIIAARKVVHIVAAKDLHQQVPSMRFAGSAAIIPSNKKLFSQAFHNQRNSRLIT